jgi:hypothetical protein
MWSRSHPAKPICERKRLWKASGKGRGRKLKGTAEVEFIGGTICHAEIHWSPTGLGRKNTRSSGSLGDMKREAQFVICIGNKTYPASLELRKIYQVIPDKAATRLHQIRVIDESGEDYLYWQDFVLVQLPQAVMRAVGLATASAAYCSGFLTRDGSSGHALPELARAGFREVAPCPSSCNDPEPSFTIY